MFGTLATEGGILAILGKNGITRTLWGTCLLTSGVIFLWSLFFSVWDLYIFLMYGCITYLYRHMWELFGRDDFAITVWGTSILSITLIIGLSVFFTLVDVYQNPKWMLKYKIQPGTNVPVDKAKLWSAYTLSLFNVVVLNVSVSILVYPIQQYSGCTADPDKLPPLWIVIRDVIVIWLIENVVFYYTHRLLHWGPLYKAFHKRHHEFTSPMVITTFYAHPVDHLLSFSLRSELGPILCGSHVCIMWFRSVWWLTVSQLHHSGYHLPFFDSPEFHDYHHLKFNVNYGGMRFFDRWHGTDHQFVNTLEEKRHKIFFSSTQGIREIIPGTVEKTK